MNGRRIRVQSKTRWLHICVTFSQLQLFAPLVQMTVIFVSFKGHGSQDGPHPSYYKTAQANNGPQFTCLIKWQRKCHCVSGRLRKEESFKAHLGFYFLANQCPIHVFEGHKPACFSCFPVIQPPNCRLFSPLTQWISD